MGGVPNYMQQLGHIIFLSLINLGCGLSPTLSGKRETIFMCLYPYTVQTRLSRDQRPTKPVSRLGTGRGPPLAPPLIYISQHLGGGGGGTQSHP